VEARDFHAPELNESHIWSTATDVFAFGIAACKLLDMRAQKCKYEAPENVREMAGLSAKEDADSVLPLALREIMLSSLSQDPNGRWQIGEIVDALDELSMGFFAENEETGRRQVEWATLNWWEAVATARQRPRIRGEDLEEDSGTLASEIT
jgi:hypothetical protein